MTEVTAKRSTIPPKELIAQLYAGKHTKASLQKAARKAKVSPTAFLRDMVENNLREQGYRVG